MSGYKDDEFCVFCNEDLIYLNQYGWFCPNHQSTVLFNYTKGNISYHKEMRIVKDGFAIFSISNSFEPEFNKIIFVEFTPLPLVDNDTCKFVIKNILGFHKKEALIDRLFYNDLCFISNNYNVISSIPNSLFKFDPNNFDKTLDKFKKLLIFS